MLNWLNTMRVRRAVRASSLEAIEASATPPSQQLSSAIEQTASALGLRLSPGRLRPLRGRIILILARQLADANKRLGSSHWTGSDGHNVGQDVLQAYRIALGVVRGTGRDGTRPPGSVDELIEALVRASADYRNRAGDPDGYGSATLGEIERDFRQLSAQAASR